MVVIEAPSASFRVTRSPTWISRGEVSWVEGWISWSGKIFFKIYGLDKSAQRRIGAMRDGGYRVGRIVTACEGPGGQRFKDQSGRRVSGWPGGTSHAFLL